MKDKWWLISKWPLTQPALKLRTSWDRKFVYSSTVSCHLSLFVVCICRLDFVVSYEQTLVPGCWIKKIFRCDWALCVSGYPGALKHRYTKSGLLNICFGQRWFNVLILQVSLHLYLCLFVFTWPYRLERLPKKKLNRRLHLFPVYPGKWYI